MIPKEFLAEVAHDRGISDSEIRVLTQAIEGNSPSVIAAKFGTRPEVIRNQLGGVYRKFQIPGAGPGKLAKLQQLLVSEYQTRQAQQASISNSTAAAIPVSEAPDISLFYGRVQELQQLTQWVTIEGCRVISVVGQAGVGKSALVAKLVESVGSEFNAVLWYALRYSPTISEMLQRLLNSLPTKTPTSIPSQESQQIGLLLECLAESRCLLVLDGFETALESGELVGQYRQEGHAYEELLQRAGATQHQSCILLTSQEKPAELEALEGTQSPIRSLVVQGLAVPEATELLKSQGLSDPDLWPKLIDSYRGNPLELRLAAMMIRDLFNGQVGVFLRRSTLMVGGIRKLLDEQFERLSSIEQDLLYWLAVVRSPLSLETLQQYFWLPVSESDVLEGLESLRRRSLLETQTEADSVRFYLQPVVMEYVATRLVEDLCTEVRDVETTRQVDSVWFLRSYALCPSPNSAPDGAAPPADCPLLESTRNKLITGFMKNRDLGGRARLENCLRTLLETLSQQPAQDVGYAIVNLHHLLNTVGNS